VKNITIIAIGSRGDVQPYIALAQGLSSYGYKVKLATHEEFKYLISDEKIELFPIKLNPREILKTKEGQNLMTSRDNPIKGINNLLNLLKSYIESVMKEIWEASKNADAIIYSLLAFIANDVAEKLKIPSFCASLQPFNINREIPHFMFPESPKIISSLYNPLTYLLAEQLTWQPVRTLINKLRKDLLDLPPRNFLGSFRDINLYGTATLYGFSPIVIPKPKNWKDNIYINGYWFLETKNKFIPSKELLDFIEDGEKPIYIGFGSMSDTSSQKTTELIIKALKKTNQKAIIATGWGGLEKTDTSDNIFFVETIPHDWLFSKVSAVIHHGGSGTTAAGLKAGIPTIITPFFGDQNFWAQRCFNLGVSPKPILYKNLNLEFLINAINKVTTDDTLINRANYIGEMIRQENGVENAVKIINKYLI